MTTLSHPSPLSQSPPHPARRPHRHHHRGSPQQLPRPVPRSTWDPLTVDVETRPPREEYDLPAALDVVPPPLEDLSKVASILTKAVVEVLLGSRSPGQVQAWLLEDVWHVVRRRASLGQRASGGERPPAAVRIIRVHPCRVDERTCEVSVVLHDGLKVRAAALRLALHRQRWRAAAIRIG